MDMRKLIDLVEGKTESSDKQLNEFFGKKPLTKRGEAMMFLKKNGFRPSPDDDTLYCKRIGVSDLEIHMFNPGKWEGRDEFEWSAYYNEHYQTLPYPTDEPGFSKSFEELKDYISKFQGE